MNVSPANGGTVTITRTMRGVPEPVITSPRTMAFGPTSSDTLTSHTSCIDLNSTVISTATPKTGYKFDHWVASPSTQGFSTTINPSSFVWDGSNKFESWSVTAYFVQSSNLPPVADAGTAQTVNEGSVVTLNGSESYDPAQRPITYHWSQISGDTTVTLTNSATARPTFTAPQVQQGGDTLTFRVTVSNDLGLTDTDDINIKIQDVAGHIQADAGDDQVVKPGDTVTLNGSGSTDSDGQIVSYRWTVNNRSETITDGSIVLQNSDSMICTFVAPDVTGWVEIMLTVRGSSGNTAPDTMTVTIRKSGGGTGPTADAGPAQVVLSGASVQLIGSGSTDPDDGIKKHLWTQLLGDVPAVTLSGSDELNPSATLETDPTFTAPIIESGKKILTFQLTVEDNSGNEDTALVEITVVSQDYVLNNLPPTANAGPDQTVEPETQVTLNGSGSTDPEGKIISYHWDVVEGPDSIVPWDSTGVQTSFITPAESGSATIELTVTDDATKTDTDTVVIAWANDPPVAVADADATTVLEGDQVVLDASASSDSDDGIASYLWEQTNGPAVALSDAASVYPTFDAPSVNGGPATLTFKLTVKDHAEQADTDEITITVNNSNQPPEADAGNNQSVNETALVDLKGSGTDPDGTIQSYQWRQTSGKAVVLSDTAVARPSFEAPSVAGDDIVLTFELTVTDNDGATNSDQVTITVQDEGAEPQANAGEDQVTYEGNAITLDGSGSMDPDGTIQSYQWSQVGTPSVALTGANTISPSFVAPSVDTPIILVFYLTVQDNSGLRGTDEVRITVMDSTRQPTANAGSDQIVDEGDMVILDGSASSDPDDGIKSYHWEQLSGEPVALTDTTSQKPAFEAPKISENTAVLSFQLTVQDTSGGTGSDQVAVTIENNSDGGGGGCFISTMHH